MAPFVLEIFEERANLFLTTVKGCRKLGEFDLTSEEAVGTLSLKLANPLTNRAFHLPDIPDGYVELFGTPKHAGQIEMQQFYIWAEQIAHAHPVVSTAVKNLLKTLAGLPDKYCSIAWSGTFRRNLFTLANSLEWTNSPHSELSRIMGILEKEEDEYVDNQL